jgi:hypothetical protein
MLALALAAFVAVASDGEAQATPTLDSGPTKRASDPTIVELRGTLAHIAATQPLVGHDPRVEAKLREFPYQLDPALLSLGIRRFVEERCEVPLRPHMAGQLVALALWPVPVAPPVSP